MRRDDESNDFCPLARFQEHAFLGGDPANNTRAAFSDRDEVFISRQKHIETREHVVRGRRIAELRRQDRDGTRIVQESWSNSHR